jgi:hypothetical protein
MAMMVGAFCFLQACRSTPPSTTLLAIQWKTLPQTHQVVVEVQGLSQATLEQLRKANWEQARWQRLFAVFAGSQTAALDETLPPTSGAYSVETETLRFTPQFPMQPAVKYLAIFQPDQLPGAIPSADQAEANRLSSSFELPAADAAASTTVTHVYPSADLLPENLLKFYLHFSAPMSRGNIYEHIRLLDSTGKPVELPFLEIDEELWDPSMTRLTLFIDPGRIKRGVKPLEEIGPALEEGKSYRLVINSAWKDGAGNSLKEAYDKSFRVGPPDRETPNPEGWRLEPPRAESLAPMAVIFPESMDSAVTRRVIQVLDESGSLITGTVSLEDEERRWLFTPEKPWRRGAYRLGIQTTIEDLAGNNIGKPFDVDTLQGGQQRTAAGIVRLNFKIE